VLSEVKGLKIFVACTLSSIDQISDLGFLFILPSAVVLNKVIDSQVSATNTDDNSLAFNLHENSFTVISINAYGLSLEVHLAPHLERLRVDEVC
jgi:hypothetical protein